MCSGYLLDGGHSTIAGRLAGAFRSIGREQDADSILQTMRVAGYTVDENDPFKCQPPVVISARETSLYVNRMRMNWAHMRSDILTSFPEAPGLGRSVAFYMKQVDELYVSDANNSLSIEGYKVSAELIGRVRSGHWNPDSDKSDHDHRDAMAARGYWLSFQSVRQSEAVRDLMPAFFELLQQEEEAAVRVVLGHFMFVYIHSCFDGNGRTGRFLMNLMMASGGYPWTQEDDIQSAEAGIGGGIQGVVL